MKLATIESIRALHPIPKSDKIELAEVLGFRTVVKKGDFRVGDLCIFHLPDTQVDANNPKYSFLASNNYRIKTVKLRGVYSQGLAMPIDLLDSAKYPMTRDTITEGADVSEYIGITKYEKPAPTSADCAGLFPDGVPRTDEPNLLTCPDWIDLFKGDFAYITKKMDGTSATYLQKDGRLCVCSRNMEVKDGNNPYWNMARKYNLTEVLANNPGCAIQGEIYGPSIQGNKCGAAEVDLALFNLFDLEVAKYKDVPDLKNFCDRYNIPMVRTIWSGKFEFGLEELQEMANKLRYGMNDALPAEGIVVRPLREKQTPTFARLSAKIISQEFGAKYGE